MPPLSNKRKAVMAIEVERNAPWRLLNGARQVQDATSATDALRKAGLNDWQVRTVPLSHVVGSEFSVTNPKKMHVTVRSGQYGQEILGAVGSRYIPVQNEQVFDWADAIVQGGAKWDTAGQFKGGTKVFGTMLVDNDLITIDRDGINDKVSTYLMVSSSHDGSLPLQASITHMRIVCYNTFNTALDTVKGTNNTFIIRHTASQEGKMMFAQQALGLTFKNAETFNEVANKMYQTPVTSTDYARIINWLYPDPGVGNKKAKTQWDNLRSQIFELSFSHTNKDIRETKWGLFNTLTERVDWLRNTSSLESLSLASSGFTQVEKQEKQRILEAVLAL